MPVHVSASIWLPTWAKSPSTSSSTCSCSFLAVSEERGVYHSVLMVKYATSMVSWMATSARAVASSLPRWQRMVAMVTAGGGGKKVVRSALEAGPFSEG